VDPQRPTLGCREHEGVRVARPGQVRGQLLDHEPGQPNRAPAGPGLEWPDVQHASDLDHDLGHLDGPAQQIDAAAAQPGQLPDPQAAVGAHQDQGAVAGPDGVGQGGDLGRPQPARLCMTDFVGSTACPRWSLGMPRCPPSPRVQGRADRPARNQEGARTMTEASVSFAGNLTDNPELRHTEGGIARAVFRVAVSGRREQETSFFTVVVWRDQAEHAAESLSKGNRVVVVGRLQQRSWTAEDGSARSVVEVVAEELGASLRWATTTRATRRARPG
jgi:single-strand DNA-binding protein